MYIADKWQTFEVLDTGEGEKLERWGKFVLCRPDPQVIWPQGDPSLWSAAQAHYLRSERGGGEWRFREKLQYPRRIFVWRYQRQLTYQT